MLELTNQLQTGLKSGFKRRFRLCLQRSTNSPSCVRSRIKKFNTQIKYYNRMRTDAAEFHAP